ncbi:DUF58 domain-containing protein [Evansella clarkii]|uniref:DUF58 domain-containing protein n=1 Tax=Evansella clarkii TaxID=79879 RepID=UPI001FD2F03F|nr:DUF58 domain-containing protein [Evansella clarkii]
MTRSLTNLWGRFLFRDRGVLPALNLLIAAIVLSFIIIAAAFAGVPWVFIISGNLLLLAVSLLDLLFSPGKKDVGIRRIMAEELERGKDYSVKLEIDNHSPYDCQFTITDGLPQSFKRPFPLRGTAEGRKKTAIIYETRAPVRGDYEINKLYIRYKSRLGLWEKQLSSDIQCQVKVIPDLTDVKEYLENAQRFLMYEGEKIRRRRSGSGEFAKVRNYVVGDDPRTINWRQTAKLQEVMANEYEPEHGKYITVLIDCGRMMGAELKKGNRLERSLEAGLTVAAAALQKGDYVSVIAFGKDVKTYVPPAKGMGHLQTILQAVYSLEAEAAEPNYGEVLNYLQTVQKKRSLLLLFSDVRTFLHEESALHYIKRLRQRHLFLMLGIEDERLKQHADASPADVQAAMVRSMAQHQLLIKQREKVKWEKQGLHMMEAREERLASAAVSNYIDIMNRGLL